MYAGMLNKLFQKPQKRIYYAIEPCGDRFTTLSPELLYILYHIVFECNIESGDISACLCDIFVRLLTSSETIQYQVFLMRGLNKNLYLCRLRSLQKVSARAYRQFFCRDTSPNL